MALGQDIFVRSEPLISALASAAATALRSHSTFWADTLMMVRDDDAVLEGDGLIRYEVEKLEGATIQTVPMRYPGVDPGIVRDEVEEFLRYYAPSQRLYKAKHIPWTRKLFADRWFQKRVVKQAKEVGATFDPWAEVHVGLNQVSAVWPPFGQPPVSISGLTFAQLDTIAALRKQFRFPRGNDPKYVAQFWMNPAFRAKVATISEFIASNERGQAPSQYIRDQEFPYTLSTIWKWGVDSWSHTAGTASSSALTLSADVQAGNTVAQLTGATAGETLLTGDSFVFTGDDVGRVVLNPNDNLKGVPGSYTADSGGNFVDVRFDPAPDSLVAGGTGIDQYGDMDFCYYGVPAAFTSSQFSYRDVDTFGVAQGVDLGSDGQPGTGLLVQVIFGDLEQHSSFVDVVWLGGATVVRPEHFVKIRVTT